MVVRVLLLIIIGYLLPLDNYAVANDTPVNTPVTVGESIDLAPIHDLSPWGMYQAADIVVKSVLIGLLAASVLTWTILLVKYLELRRSRRQARELLDHITNSKNFSAIDTTFCNNKTDTSAFIDAYRHELILSDNVPSTGLKERIEATLSRAQAAAIANANQGTGLLATIGSVAPFIGLFGTVWGIMNSFIGIAQSQTTNLAVVAPGIAEALLATATGLLAAIPAVVFYNYFSRLIAAYRATLTDITTALMILLSRDIDQQALLPAAESVEQQAILKDAS